ncbi:MAG: helicase-related protein, partial [Eubacterium sp.]
MLNYKCSAVLCSATQPEFNRFFKKEIIEICENKKELFDQLNRVKIVYQKDQTIEWLSEEMNKQEQCLMVVNTKKMARELYQKLKGNEGNYHLSTYMCPIHRRMVIEAIKDRLQKGQSCKVVSTNLVEAGVDFDFPMVFRELAGLDSIIQAAGRCNRERRLSEGKVIVFTIVQDQIMAKKTPAEDYLQRQKILTKEIFENYENVCTLEAISVYYNKLYDNYGEQALDYKQILEMINEEKSFKFPLKTIGEAFKLIDEESCTVLVKYNDEAEGL